MLALGTEEYLLTAGILAAFVGLLLSVISGRHEIFTALRKRGFGMEHIGIIAMVLFAFLVLELFFVGHTQQLFFDDDIYQAMAQQLLHTGQAWMCDYGTPTTCYSGEVFHEPVGTSFNLAIGFALLGVKRSVAFGVNVMLSMLAVVATFLAALLMFNKKRIALFSSALMALSPVVLMWAAPTTSDVPMLAYSLVAFFFLLLFREKKNLHTFSMLGFSMVLLAYMKVNAILFFLVALLIYMILDDKSVVSSIKNNARLVTRNLENTNLLVVVLVLVLAIAPAVIFDFNQLSTGDFGYAGSYVQNSCGGASMTASGNFNIQNFEYNVCANVMFWFDAFKNQYIIQPTFFTALALLGMFGLLLDKRRRELLALLVWFGAFFLLYTAFYAGAATYGVDWRFMLSMIAQVSILGGYGCFVVTEIVDNISRGWGKKRGMRWRPETQKDHQTIWAFFASFALLFLMLLAIFLLLQQISIAPSSLQQAGDARYYENFIYANSNLIPSNCLVFTYDPTLFQINNRSAAQMSYIYNAQFMKNVTAQWSCMVVDYGYWCYTPNNLCTALNQTVTLSPIVTTNYAPMGRTFGLYYAKLK